MKNKIYSLLTLICLTSLTFGLFGEEPAERTSLLQASEKIERDYDRSDLNDYVIYRLYALDPQMEYFSRSFYHIYTANSLTKESALPIIAKQITNLQQTIAESYETLALDELLRHRIVSLAESLKTLALISPEETADSTQLKEQAFDMIEQGLNRYGQMKNAFNQYVKSHEAAAQNPEDRLLRDLTRFASIENRVADYAKRFEAAFDTEAWTKVKEACGATANALFYYFHEQGLIVSRKDTQEGIDTLMERLAKNRGISTHGHLYLIDSAQLDHVFTIQQTSDGRYRLLQSFINKYSLLASLTSQSQSLSYEEMIDVCQQLKSLIEADRWDANTAALYKQLFLTSPEGHVQKDYGRKDQHLSFSEITYTPS